MKSAVVAPIPQANDLAKVLKIPFLVSKGKNKAVSIIRDLKLGSTRQGQYYFKAAELLNLVQGKSEYSLTKGGEEFIMSTSSRQKNLVFESIKSLTIVSSIESFARNTPDRSIESEDIINLIVKLGYATSTAKRRADTILNWFNWIQFHFPQYCICNLNTIKFL